MAVDDAGSREATLAALEDAIESQRSALVAEGPESRGAVDDCLLLVRSWLEGDVTAVLEARTRAGMRFRRASAVNQCKAAVRWGFAEPYPEEWLATATDAELFSAIAEGQRVSGLDLQAFDVGAVRVLRRAGLTMGGEAWPYRGSQGCHSLFEGPRGPRQDLLEVDRTPESLSIILRVRLRDGRAGLLNFPYAWDDEIVAWVPVNVDIGVDSGKYWPWPFAN